MAKSITTQRLPNGLPLLTVPMADTAAVSLLALIRVGSRLENERQRGLAHFLEHMLFKGTTSWPSARDLTQVLDAVGAEYNAFTAKEYTGYYIKAAAEYLPLIAKVLAEMLWQSRLERAEMEKEKGVIKEEINMYEDNPLLYINDVLEGELFKGSTLAHLISGSRQSVASLTQPQLSEFWRQYYHPRNMLLAAAGKIKATPHLQLRRIFNQVRQGGRRGKFRYFAPAVKRPRLAIHFKNTAQVQLAYAFPSYGWGHRDLPALRLLAVILGGNMSSRLFVRLREQEGLCYTVRCSTEQYHKTGLFSIQAGLDKTRLTLAIKLIQEELRKVLQPKVTADELNKAKEYTKGSLTLALEDSLAQAEWAAKHYFLESSYESSDDYLRRIKKVKASDIQRVAGHILGQNRPTLALIGPYRKTKPLRQLLSNYL